MALAATMRGALDPKELLDWVDICDVILDGGIDLGWRLSWPHRLLGSDEACDVCLDKTALSSPRIGNVG